jgi:hypothetical protein
VEVAFCSKLVTRREFAKCSLPSRRALESDFANRCPGRFMDAKLVWMGALFVAVALCVVLYFVFEQERKKIADARREMTEQDEKS